MDNSRSYLGGSALDGMGVAGGGGGLRDTAINSHDLEDNSRNRYLASLRFVVVLGGPISRGKPLTSLP